MSEKNEYLTIEETATILRVTVKSVRNYIDDGRLTAYKFTGKYLVKRSELEELIVKSKI